jgi:DNA polymerase-1
MWWKKFILYAKTQYGLDYTDKEAELLRSNFFKTYPKLEAWHKTMKAFVNKHGYVRAMHGALRRLPSIHSSDEGIRKECERQSVNSPIQRISSDMGLTAMSRFAQGADLDVMCPLLFIHDDVTIECRDDMLQEGAAYLRWCMQNPPVEWFDMEMPIPLLSDLQIGKSLGDMKDMKDVEPIKPPWIP